MSTEIDETFRNFDSETGSYLLADIKIPLRELTVDELEQLQDKEAEMNEIDATKLKPSEILKLTRDWNEFVLEKGFGKDYKKLDLKKKCTAAQYTLMIAEVFVFLAKFSGPKSLQDYITSLTERKVSLEKTKDS